VFTRASGIREDWLQAFFVGLCPEDKRKKTGTEAPHASVLGHSDLVIDWITVSVSFGRGQSLQKRQAL